MTTTAQRMMDVAELGVKSKDDLLVLAQDFGLEDGAALAAVRREDLLNRLLHAVSAHQALVSSGILEIMDEGYGFLRQITYLPATGDVYISQSQIRRFGLRTGDTVTGQVRPPKEGERYFGLVRVEQVQRAGDRPGACPLPGPVRIPDPHLPGRTTGAGDR